MPDESSIASGGRLLNSVRDFRRLMGSRFARNVAVVAGGTAAAQAIGIAFMPIITRMYGPEAFGLLGAFAALVGIASPIVTLSYPIAIVLPREDSEATALVRLSVLIAAFISLSILVIVIFAEEWIARPLEVESLIGMLFLVPIVLFFSALVQVSKQWLIRKKRFDVTAKAEIAQTLIINCLKVFVGLLSATGTVLVALGASGATLQAALLGYGIRRTGTWHSKGSKHSSSQSLMSVAKKHYDFPAYRCPQILINSISQNLPVLMLSAFFGPAAAGFYALGRRIVGAPIRLIGNSVGEVFYPRIVETIHAGQSPFRLLTKATGVMAVAGAPLFGIIIVFGPLLFAFIFGVEWERAGDYARWLALWMYFGFLNRPSVATVPSLGLQRGLLFYEVFSTGTKLVALYLGFFIFKDDLVAVAAFGTVGALAYISLILWVCFKAARFKTISTIENERTDKTNS